MPMENTGVKRHITVVDDIPENIHLVGALLREQGFMLSIAGDGKQAVEVVQNNKPDLVLMDVMMPNMDGYEACIRLKQDPLTRDIPVIFMSALTEPVDKIKGFNAGAVDYLTKPVHKEEMLARINTHLTIGALHKKLEVANAKLEEKVRLRTKELETKNLDLEKNREILNSILSSMDDLVFALDRNGVFLNFTQESHEDRLYKPSKAFIGKSYKEILPQDIADTFDKAITLLNNSGKPQQVDYPLSFEGKVRWFSAKLTMRLDNLGSYTGITAVIRDVTEKKIAAEALREANKIINRSPVVVFLRQNKTGWPVDLVSQSVDRIFGYSESDFISGKVNYSDIIHPEDRNRFSNEIAQIIHGKSPDDFSHKPYRIVTKEGKTKWLDDRTQIRRNREGIITHFQGIVLDITEQKRTEDQLRQVQKMETVGTIAGGLAHDFNNLLGGVLAVLSLLRSKLESNETIKEAKLKKYIDIMYSASLRATNTVKQLLALSRRQELIFTPIDLNKVIQQVINICEATIDKSVNIVPHFLNHEVMVEADLTALEQLVLNLCVNSAHAMTIMRDENETWGGDLTIKLAAESVNEVLPDRHPNRKVGEYWVVSIEDTGVGMESETLSKIFDPFFTTKKIEHGTGLGLAMVLSTISQLNGFIDVVSKKGVGSTFSIHLPVLKDHLAAQNEVDKDIKQHSGEGLILVVDDEFVFRTAVEELLEELGYRVILAANGLEGVNLFKQHYQDISAVLLDLSMPRMSGKETFIKLREIDPSVKVLLTSGYWQNERIQELTSLGIKGFIQKPLTLKKLSKAVYSTVFD